MHRKCTEEKRFHFPQFHAIISDFVRYLPRSLRYIIGHLLYPSIVPAGGLSSFLGVVLLHTYCVRASVISTIGVSRISFSSLRFRLLGLCQRHTLFAVLCFTESRFVDAPFLATGPFT